MRDRMIPLPDDLNEQQREAVTATEGYVRVVAGAGSGKTRCLTRRFAYLINELGILPGNILCVTFTNKAANEMRARIHDLTGDHDVGYVNTFHGFCVTVLREDIHAVWYPAGFLVLDNSDIDDILRQIYEDRGLTLRDMSFSRARDMIEIQKLLKKPDYYLDMIDMSLDTLKRKYDEATEPKEVIFYGYLYHEKKAFALDYNDLIKFTLCIFDRHPEIRRKWQERLEYIMIDEFQDIDPPQYQLMRVLCGYHGNLFIVGDPDQTIYTWRGARVEYLLNFDQEFANVHTVMMNDNYRSTPQIVAAVNSLIDKNTVRIRKSLYPNRTDGPGVRVLHGENPEDEAAKLARAVAALIKQGVARRDIAVLYRARHLTRPVEDALIQAKIPYHIYGSVQFFARKEIKDALAYMRMAVCRDDLSFLRTVNTPKRNVGKSRVERIRGYAAAHGCTLYQALQALADTPEFAGTKAHAYIRLIEKYAQEAASMTASELLSHILNDSGYERMLRTEGAQNRLDDLAQLKQAVIDYEQTCGEECTPEYYLTRVALFSDADAPKDEDAVKLMTIHAAKGLEFDHVFLIGMNEGVFPSDRVKTFEAMEEERRLAFVAMTRARRTLTLTEADGRTFDNAPRYPSRFLLDIDGDLLEYDEPPADSLVRDAREYIRLRTERLESADRTLPFGEGQRVRHPVLGEGTILDADPQKNTYTVQFDALPTPRKINAKAKLEAAD